MNKEGDTNMPITNKSTTWLLVRVAVGLQDGAPTLAMDKGAKALDELSARLQSNIYARAQEADAMTLNPGEGYEY